MRMTFEAVAIGGEGSGWRGELSIKPNEGIVVVESQGRYCLEQLLLWRGDGSSNPAVEQDGSSCV